MKVKRKSSCCEVEMEVALTNGIDKEEGKGEGKYKGKFVL